jgi:hypothetical protein
MRAMSRGQPGVVDDAGRLGGERHPSNFALATLSARTIPPARLMSMMPREPSLPLPDSTTATACGP